MISFRDFLNFCWLWIATRNLFRLIPGLIVIAAVVAVVVMVIQSRTVTASERIIHYMAAANKASGSEEWDRAELCYRRVLGLKSGHQEARYGLAMVADEKEDFGRAGALMHQLSLEVGTISSVANLWMVKQRLKDEKPLGDTERFQTIVRLNKVLQHIPNETQARTILAVLYQQAGEQDKCIEHMRKAAKIDPNMQLRLLQFLHQFGEEEQAQLVAQAAVLRLKQNLNSTPEDHNVRSQYASTLVYLQSYPEAVKILRKGILLGASTGLKRQLASTLISWAYYARKENDRSVDTIALLTAALQYTPNNPRAFVLLNDLTKEVNDGGKEAKQILEKRLAEGKTPAMIHLILGTSALEDGNNEKGIFHLEQASKINPRAAITLNNLAYVLAHEEEPDLERAEKLVGQALKIAPKNPQIIETRGQIYRKTKQWKKALSDFESILPHYSRVKQLRPALPELHASLADVYENLGNESMAEQHRKLSVVKKTNTNERLK